MTHLSSDQVFEWTLGERDPEIERHLRHCVTCNREVSGLEQGLRVYRQSVLDWAARPVSMEIPAQRVHTGSWAWTAAVTAVATSLALVPLYLDVRQARLEARNVQDSELLDEVQARLTRNVPQSMQTLMELMAEGKEERQ
jgi:membrane protein insertase Oxa1/YidC/SpoIIIJ